jgi:hypothetical protein
MAGWNNERRLPGNWGSTIRPRILRRDPVCELGLPNCTVMSTEVDHIGVRDDHDDGNLRGVCSACHAVRSRAQSAEWRKKYPRERPRRQHPGLR